MIAMSPWMGMMRINKAMPNVVASQQSHCWVVTWAEYFFFTMPGLFHLKRKVTTNYCETINYPLNILKVVR